MRSVVSSRGYLSRLAITLAAVSGLAATNSSALAQCATQFNFSDFLNLSPLTLNESATPTMNGVIQLPPGLPGKRSSFYHTQQAAVRNGFETTFTFRLDGTADGFSFIIQNDSPSVTGGTGSALGFGEADFNGIRASLAIEFDTFSFPNEFPEDHISIQTRGEQQNSADDQASLAHVQIPFDINDGANHTARIIYENGILQVFLDNLSVPILQTNLDLSNLNDSDILRGGDCAWVGFTGSSGAAFADQNILSWSFTSFDGSCRNADFVTFVPDATIRAGRTGVFEFIGSGSLPLNGFWQKQGDPDRIVDGGRFAGATTQRLIISNLQVSDSGRYDYGVENSCSGIGTSFLLTVLCPADFNEDNTVDFFDYLDFVAAFANEDSSADYNGDNTIDFFDYLDFVADFANECP